MGTGTAKTSSARNERKAGRKKPPKSTEETTAAIQRKGDNKNKNTATEKKTTETRAPARVARLAKTPTQKSFVLDHDKGTPDPLLLKSVCFDVNDQNYGTRLANHLYPKQLHKLKPSLRIVNGTSYLFGTVIGDRKKKKGSSSDVYDIQWEDDTLGVTPVAFGIVMSAIELSRKVNQLDSDGPFSPDSVFNKDVLSFLVNNIEEGETGTPLDSDNEDETDDGLGYNRIVYGQLKNRFQPDRKQRRRQWYQIQMASRPRIVTTSWDDGEDGDYCQTRICAAVFDTY